MSKIIVTAGNRSVDIDVFACIIAYAELLKIRGIDVIPIVEGNFTMSVPTSVLGWGANYEKSYKAGKEDSFVLVDISDPEYLASFVNIDKVIEVYDHRQGHEDFWGNKLGDNSHIEMVGACGTLIWEEFNKQERKQISEVSARLLLASIVSNTLNFKAPVTTDRDRNAYSELKDIAELQDNWIKDYFIEQEQLLISDFKKYLQTDTKVSKINNNDFVIGQIELWDAEEIINTKTSEINEVMESFGQHPWIVNIPNISKGFNYIYSTNQEAKKIIEEKLGLEFVNNVAKTPKLIMRKQIMKILKDIS